MRDFDTDKATRRAQRIDPENLTFRIAGNEFVVRSGFAPGSPGADAIKRFREMNEDTSDEDFNRISDETVMAFLHPGQEEKWKAARDPDIEHPITGSDLVDIVIWLIEAVTNRPLESSTDSSTGSTPSQPDSTPPARTGTPLTVVPRSKRAAASDASG